MTSPAPRSPADVLAELKSIYTDKRSRDSLDIIDEVCRDISACAGAFTLKIVGTRSQAKGGIGARALANADGARYRALIAAYKDAGAPARRAPERRNEEEELLSTVADMDHKARLRVKLAEGRALNRKVRALQALADQSAQITLALGPTSASLPTAQLGRTEVVDLKPTEMEALRTALDPDRLRRVDLRLDAYGSVLDASEQANGSVRREIMPLGFAVMLRKLASAVGVEIRDAESSTSRT